MTDSKHRIIDLSYLFKTTAKIAKAKDLQSTCEVIFDFIESIVDYNMIIIYTVNKRKDELEVLYGRGSDVRNLKRRIPFKVGEGAVGWVAKHKKALLVDDALESEYIQVRQFFDEDPIIRSFLAVPLIVGDNLIGILSMSNSEAYKYSLQNVEIISIISYQGAALLELNNKINETTKFSNHILENINSGVIVIDNDYHIIVFNKSAEKISGYSRDEVIGENILDLPLKENEKHWYIAETLDTGMIFTESSGYMINKDGTYVNIRISTSILENEDGTIKGSICIFRDNTEIERLQEQILKSEKLATIGRLTAGIAHEIRNPLLPIRTASKLLSQRLKSKNENESVLKLIGIIADESERLNRFLDQMMQMNKNSGELKGKTSIKEVVDDIILLIESDINKNSIVVEAEYADEQLLLPFNKNISKQIFLNLFLNAIDSLNVVEDGRDKNISLWAKVDNDKVIVEFSDTGCGIRNEDIDKVFEPFFSTKDRGSGLGLSTCYNLVHTAGGEMIVDSKLGKGTSFTIITPLP